MIFVFFAGCIVSIEKISKDPVKYDRKEIRIAGKVDRIFYFKDKSYIIVEMIKKDKKENDDLEINSVYVLSTKIFKRFDDIDVKGKMFYLDKNKYIVKSNIICYFKNFFIRN